MRPSKRAAAVTAESACLCQPRNNTRVVRERPASVRLLVEKLAHRRA